MEITMHEIPVRSVEVALKAREQLMRSSRRHRELIAALEIHEGFVR